MLSADWLFRNHTTHLVVIKLLNAQIDEINEMRNLSQREQNSDIESWSVARPVQDGMPREASQNSRVERIVIRLDNIYSEETYNQKQKELRQYRWFAQLYDSLLETLSTKEKWFIEQHYHQQHTLVSITELADSPFFGYDRSTVWKFKKKLLAKADAILRSV